MKIAVIVDGASALGKAPDLAIGDAEPIPGYRNLVLPSPAVVLLHGRPRTWHMWRVVIPDSAARYRVIAPDLRVGARGPGGVVADRFPRRDQAALDQIVPLVATEQDAVARLAG